MNPHTKDKQSLTNNQSPKATSNHIPTTSKYQSITQNKSQAILEMTGQYPFGQARLTGGQCLVRCIKHFRPAEYAELKRVIELNASLKHSNLIGIMRVFESKGSGQFQIFFDYIPESIENVLPLLKNEQVVQAKSDLLQLCRYLNAMGITPEISQKNIGFQGKCVKFFLDVKRMEDKTGRKDSIALKEIQIRSLFNHVARKGSVPPVRTIRNFNNSRSQEIINYPTSNIIDPQVQQPRNSSLTSFHNKKPENDRQLDLNKIKNIDDRIKKIQQHMSKPPQKHNRPSQISQAANQLYHVKNEKVPVQQIAKVIHNYMETHHYNVREGRDVPVVYPTIGLAVDNYTQQDSFDTYNQQLGEDTSIPKIIHKEMRQTTKSPPRLLFRDKLHESVGNSRNNIITNTINQAEPIPAERDVVFERSSNSRSTSMDRLQSSASPKERQLKSGSSVSELQPDTNRRRPFEKIKDDRTSSKKQITRASDCSQKDDYMIKLTTKNKYQKLKDHLNEIRNVQKEISIRKLSTGKTQTKKGERKFTQPRPSKAQIIQDDGPLKFYSLESQLVDEFNGLMNDNTDNSDNQNLFQSTIQKKMEINQRVQLALKKSEATLESFRNRMGWK